METENQDVNANIYGIDGSNQEILLGTTQIDLEELRDQNVHELLLNVVD